MTTKIAVRVVEEIVRENRENGELEGILNRHRIAAINHLLALVSKPRRVVGGRKPRAKA
jgi:hypothetical protein